MIRVLMFDLGNTLVDDSDNPFPNVREALAAIADLRTGAGDPLRSCLVSDFTLAAGSAQIPTLFNEYLEIVTAAGIRPFFEPVTERITLSTHAGVFKPQEKIFRTALERLRVDVPLSDCLLITENAEHIAAVRDRFHMSTLQFRKPGVAGFDFDDWADAPALIAALVAPPQPPDLEAAARAHLAARGIEVISAEPAGKGALKISGQLWHPVNLPEVPDGQPILVAVPATGRITESPSGGLQSSGLEPSPEEIEEAVNFARSLAAHHQISGQTAQKFGRPTHAIEVDDAGRRKLVRKRYN